MTVTKKVLAMRKAREESGEKPKQKLGKKGNPLISAVINIAPNKNPTGRWALRDIKFDKPEGFDSWKPKQKLDTIGEETLLKQIESGISFTEIAQALGMYQTDFRAWTFANKERDQAFAQAIKLSAESWIDRGLETLIKAPSNPNEIARARAIAFECARRAGVRNIRYRDKSNDRDAPSANEQAEAIRQALVEIESATCAES
jgi:hypothetical protein